VGRLRASRFVRREHFTAAYRSYYSVNDVASIAQNVAIWARKDDHFYHEVSGRSVGLVGPVVYCSSVTRRGRERWSRGWLATDPVVVVAV
jgi:hypothetical protein